MFAIDEFAEVFESLSEQGWNRCDLMRAGIQATIRFILRVLADAEGENEPIDLEIAQRLIERFLSDEVAAQQRVLEKG